jgi:hypothetical protein
LKLDVDAAIELTFHGDGSHAGPKRVGVGASHAYDAPVDGIQRCAAQTKLDLLSWGNRQG